MNIAEAKERISIWDAASAMGIPIPRKRIVSSPIRADKKPSLSISADGRLFKDFGKPDFAGDVIDFICGVQGGSIADAAKTLLRMAGGGTVNVTPRFISSEKTNTRKPFQMPELDAGSYTEVLKIKALRGLPVTAGIEWLRLRGILGFCTLRDAGEMVRCWVLYEQGKSALARRVDGKPMTTVGGLKKAKLLPGSDGTCPLGITDAEKRTTILICEGGPDALALMSAIFCATDDEHLYGVVTMPSTSAALMAAHAAAIRGKRVRIYAHTDKQQQGLTAAFKWAQQARKLGAGAVDIWQDNEGLDVNDRLIKSGEENDFFTNL